MPDEDVLKALSKADAVPTICAQVQVSEDELFAALQAAGAPVADTSVAEEGDPEAALRDALAEDRQQQRSKQR